MLKTVEDSQFNGDVDYLFSFEEVVLCVTEGKKDQLDHGIAQNIAQLSSEPTTASAKLMRSGSPPRLALPPHLLNGCSLNVKTSVSCKADPF